ncbi:MAG: PKD domain-containing protein [Bacteroidetes bacterium]|nr:PKD domain-containing protein [Bacteroidota bacterium]
MKKFALPFALIAAMLYVTGCKKQPVADFTYSPMTGIKTGQAVQFTNTSENGVTYEWNFGDGLTSDDESPSHTYTTPGTKFVELIVYSKKEKKDDKATAMLNVIPNVSVTSPSSTSVWHTGSSYTIEWTDDLSSDYVDIEIYQGGDQIGTIDYTIDNTDHDGSYNWTVPTYYDSGTDYKIRVVDYNNDSYYGESSNFTIDNSDYIEITKPVSTTVWHIDSYAETTWNTNLSGPFFIDLYKNGTFIYQLTSSTYNSGYFSNYVYTYYPTGSDYQLKIAYVYDSTIFDMSDYFTVSNDDFIEITSPISSTTWYAGDYEYVYWESNVSSTVTIELYEGGTLNDQIVSGTSNDGSYSFYLSSSLSSGNDYQIKIISDANNTIFDISDEFSVY